MELFDTASGARVRRLQARVQQVTSLELSPDGRRLLATGRRGRISVWDLERGRLVWSATHPERHLAGTFTGDGGHVVVAGNGKRVEVYAAASGALERAFEGRAPLAGGAGSLVWGSSARFKKDGSTSYLSAWNAATGAEAQTFGNSVEQVRSLGSTRDGASLVSGGHYGKVLVFASGAPVDLPRAVLPEAARYAVVGISPDGSAAAFTTLEPNTVRIVDLATNQARATVKLDAEATALALGPDGKGTLVAAGRIDGAIVLLDARSGAVVRTLTAHTQSVNALRFLPGGRLVSGSDDGSVRLFEVTTGAEVARFISVDDGDALVALPDNHYAGSRGAAAAVGFRAGDRVYPFEQFDLRFNRPDLVVAALGGPARLVETFRRAVERRLAKQGLSLDALTGDPALPEITLLTQSVPVSTAERTLHLRVRVSDARAPLSSLLVFVNGAPAAGLAGIPLAPAKGSKSKPSAPLEKDVEVQLSRGLNNVQLSALNVRGAESLRETVDVTCTAVGDAPDLYVLAVGVSGYASPEMNLTYPAKDAADLVAALGAQGSFKRAHVTKLVDAQATREGILGGLRSLSSAGVEDTVIISFAGHGLLDATLSYWFAAHDVDFESPRKGGVGFDEIEGLLASSAARHKLLLIDTCFSGEADPGDLPPGPILTDAGTVSARGIKRIAGGKGAAAQVPTPSAQAIGADLLTELFSDVRRGSGATAISASGAAEFALESPEWKNGVFTYAVLEGLRGRRADRDQDGRVTVSELRDWVVERVARLTSGKQRPTVRRDNVRFDFPVQ